MQSEIIILAAGAGTRLRSARPKPLHLLAGEPLLAHSLRTAEKLRAGKIIVVVPPKAADGGAVEEAARRLNKKAVCVVQPKANGTGGAARCALPKLGGGGGAGGTALIMFVDSPLLTAETLRRLQKKAAGGCLALLTFLADDPTGYGRILRDGGGGGVRAIVEERAATAAEKKIREVFSGVLCAPADFLRRALPLLKNNNAAGEFYLTDIAAAAAAAGLPISAVAGAADECAGVNTAADLERAEGILRRRRAAELLRRGARLADAARVDVRGEIKTGRDVEIDANVVLAGAVVLGDGARIGANCVLQNCRIGAGTAVLPFSYLADARVGKNCQIGPFARLREGADLGENVRVGNFVEVKKSSLKNGVKAGHLAYLGDAAVGAATNIGAGVITCNFDGKAKHRTIIGDGVFVGSDAQLVAPVRIGRGAFVAAGTTVTDDVPPANLAIGRGRQVNKARRGRRDS